MAEIKKFLDSGGLAYFCKKFQDYPSNEILGAVINAIDNTKVDKIEGKGLSTNDYTNEDKNKLDSSITFNEQILTESQQAQARTNIRAADKQDVEQLISDVHALDRDVNGYVDGTPVKHFRISFNRVWNANKNTLHPSAAVAELRFYDADGVELPIESVTADSEYSAAYSAAKVLDGDLATFWSSEDAEGVVHTLECVLAEAGVATRIGIVPRKDVDVGRPDELTVEASADGAVWTQVLHIENEKDGWESMTWRYFDLIPTQVIGLPIQTQIDACRADAVLHTMQSLTEDQKAQARANIAAAGAQDTAKISEDVDTLMGVFVTERTVTKKYSFDVVVGKSIYADKYSFDGLSIASGKAYKVLFTSDSASFTNIWVYEKYDDGTNKSYSVNFNTEKQVNAQGNIVAFAIYLDGGNITQGGTVDMTVTYMSTNEDSFQHRLSKLEEGMQAVNGAISEGYTFTAKLANQVTNAAKEFYVLVDDAAVSYKKGDCLLIDVEITASEQISWLDHRFTWDDGTTWRLGYPTRDYNNYNRRVSFVCTMVLDKDRTLKKIANYCSPVEGNTNAAAYEVCYTIEKVESCVEEIPLPDYYHADGYIESKADAINGYLDACAANGDAFFYLTDVHWEQNAMRSPAIICYLRQHTGIDTVLNGGDNYFGRPTTGIRDVTLALRRAVGDRVYLSDGNHEFAGFVAAGLTYSAKFAPNNLHTRDAVYGSDAHTYYYVDRPDNRMRYVFLQAFGYDETAAETSGGYTAPMKNDPAQLEWFTNTALNVEAGWTIVIVAHCFYTFDGSGNPILMDGAEGYADAINGYSGAGTIACVLSGHTHRDAILYLGATGTGVPNILTTCDKFMKASDDDMPNGITREPHTISEQAVDAVIIDKTNRSIKIVRIGGQAGAWSGTADAGTRVEMREASY